MRSKWTTIEKEEIVVDESESITDPTISSVSSQHDLFGMLENTVCFYVQYVNSVSFVSSESSEEKSIVGYEFDYDDGELQKTTTAFWTVTLWVTILRTY